MLLDGNILLYYLVLLFSVCAQTYKAYLETQAVTNQPPGTVVPLLRAPPPAAWGRPTPGRNTSTAKPPRTPLPKPPLPPRPPQSVSSMAGSGITGLGQQPRKPSGRVVFFSKTPATAAKWALYLKRLRSHRGGGVHESSCFNASHMSSSRSRSRVAAGAFSICRRSSCFRCLCSCFGGGGGRNRIDER